MESSFTDPIGCFYKSLDDFEASVLEYLTQTDDGVNLIYAHDKSYKTSPASPSHTTEFASTINESSFDSNRWSKALLDTDCWPQAPLGLGFWPEAPLDSNGWPVGTTDFSGWLLEPEKIPSSSIDLPLNSYDLPFCPGNVHKDYSDITNWSLDLFGSGSARTFSVEVSCEDVAQEAVLYPPSGGDSDLGHLEQGTIDNKCPQELRKRGALALETPSQPRRHKRRKTNSRSGPSKRKAGSIFKFSVEAVEWHHDNYTPLSHRCGILGRWRRVLSYNIKERDYFFTSPLNVSFKIRPNGYELPFNVTLDTQKD
ncbi:hypothetical protein PG997_014708 [Apiospora hydei]|uniref:Uncharacterized protein n=1 Tax=Apiospora hydei TaxID=1337664 RepID=A0ABR1UUL1_9PEZI